MGPGVIIAIVIGGLLLILMLMYNSLINKRNRVDQLFATMDVMLKKRHDLIPNLVAAVKQYMTHERDVLTNITELRAQATSGSLSPDQQTNVENQLTASLGRLMAVAEGYPDLKANTNFLQLQGALNEVEEQLSAARRAYNSTVTDYNNAIQMFPTNIMASMMGMQRRAWFEIPEIERQNVDVNALFQR